MTMTLLPVSRATAPTPRALGWICRYLPAQVAGTAAMIVAGLTVTFWTDSAGFIALAGLLGEVVGFTVVLAVTIYGEQSSQLDRTGRRRRGAASRAVAVRGGHFAPAQLLDVLLVRPVCLVVGVWLIGDPVGGLLIGKIAADIVLCGVIAALGRPQIAEVVA